MRPLTPVVCISLIIDGRFSRLLLRVLELDLLRLPLSVSTLNFDVFSAT